MGTIKNEIIEVPEKKGEKEKEKRGKWRDPFIHLHLWR
jgi:hypothetical protein